MDAHLEHDLAHLTGLLAAAQEFAAQNLADLAERPAAIRSWPPANEPSQDGPLPKEPLPDSGEGGLAALALFAERWAPGISASAGPRYLGFVTGGATPAAVIGDWLTSVFDQNSASAEQAAAAAVEKQTISWLREMFGLGTEHEGAFVSGATTSNFVGLAIAREWVGQQLGSHTAQTGLQGPVPVLSGTPHSSIYKSLAMTGIGRDSLRLIPVLPGREAVDVAALEAALRELNGRPAIVVANAGTVNTVDFDDISAIAALRERYPFWLHVDGAFGAFAALSPERASLLEGIDGADSVCVDLHKWLNVPYDSAVQFTRHRDLQLEVFSAAADYLGAMGDEPDYMHLVPESSRRFRALAAWMTLAAYGRDGHREIVTRDIACAQDLGARIDSSEHLRLLAPVRLNVACFTLASGPTTARVAAFVNAVADSGEAFVTPTVYGGTPGVRAAFSNWRTGPADVDRIFAALTRAAASL
jgi:glutamate/tyrosine decarboxylase-like PLP-dependent enzyme